MSAVIPPDGSGTTSGVAKWTDVVDNVRALDLEWLQNRSILRFPDASTRDRYPTLTGSVPGVGDEGQATYMLDSHRLTVNTGAGGYKTVLMSNQLAISEVGSGANQVAEISNNGAAGVSLGADGVVGVNSLKVASTAVQLSNAGITVKTGSKAVNLSTDGGQLLVDSSLKVTGTLSVVGGLGVTGNGSFTGPLTASALQASGNISSTAGTITAPNVEGTLGVRTAQLNITNIHDNSIAGLQFRSRYDNRLVNSFVQPALGSGIGAQTRVGGVRIRTRSRGVSGVSYPGTPVLGNTTNEALDLFQPVIQCGTFVGNAALGAILLTFEEPFTTAVHSVVVSNGDPQNTSGTLFFDVANGTMTLSNVQIYVRDVLNGTPANGQTLRVNYIAIGY